MCRAEFTADLNRPIHLHNSRFLKIFDSEEARKGKKSTRGVLRRLDSGIG